MGIGSIVAAVAPVVGGIIGGRNAGDAAGDAAASQLRASRESIEAQERALAQLRQDLAPFSQFGAAALGPLSGALGIQAAPQAAPQAPSVAPAPFTAPVTQGRPGAAAPAQPAPSRADVLEQIDQLDAVEAQLERARNAPGRRIPGAVTRLEQQRQELLQNLPQTAEGQAAIQSRLEAGTLPGNILQQQVLAPGGVLNPQAPAAAPAPQFTPQPFESRADQIGGEGNPLLQQAIRARQEGRQLNPLLQQAIQGRQESRAGSFLGPELLQNPLLQALQQDVTRRVFANQAARGRLGSGSTVEELQNRLVPQAIQLGLSLENLRERELAGQAGLGLNLEELAERQLGAQTNLGLGVEDLRQREVQNLFQAAGIGQSAAARTGAAGQAAAGNIGNLATAGAAAAAPFTLGQAQARNAQIGSVIGGLPNIINQLRPPGDAAGLVRPVVGGQQLAGPFQATGVF